jgi:hypothetical protein
LVQRTENQGRIDLVLKPKEKEVQRGSRKEQWGYLHLSSLPNSLSVITIHIMLYIQFSITGYIIEQSCTTTKLEAFEYTSKEEKSIRNSLLSIR